MMINNSILISIFFIVYVSCQNGEKGNNKTQPPVQKGQNLLETLDYSKSVSIRLTFNYDAITSNSTYSQNSKQLVIDATESSGLFIKNLLKVHPRINPLLIQEKYSHCFTKEERPSLPKQVDNTDLFIFLSWFEDDSSVIAKSGTCTVDGYSKIARIFVNHKKINAENKRYQNDQLIKIFLHEITHILVFSKSMYTYWVNPKTNLPYGASIFPKLVNQIIGQQNYTVFSTPKSKQYFQTHYKCLDILGPPLEELASKSHFSQTAVRDELMNGHITKISAEMTQHLLGVFQDSNFFTEVNDNLFTYSGWGYHQGCSYFSFVNNTQTQVQEQLNLISPKLMDSKCDPAGYGKYNTLYQLNDKNAFDKSTSTFCSIIQISDSKYSGEEFSNESKCYSSSLQVNTVYSPFFSEYKNTRCFKTICLESGSLQLETSLKQTFKCDFPGQRIEVQEEQVKGYIICPHNFEIFCGKKLFCKDDCGLKGFCLKGVCVCRDGYGGLDCQTELKKNEILYENNIVQNCPDKTYLNPNNVCMSDCLEGYFKSGNVCLKCSNKCSQCTGPNKNQCTKCNMQYQLQNGECNQKLICHQKKQETSKCLVCAGEECTSCLSGYFLKDGSCIKCEQNCLECHEQPGFCLSCKSDYILQQNKCVSVNLVMKGCLQVNLNNPQLCQKCEDNYFLDSKDQCVQCQEGHFYDLQKQECQKCSSNCKTCINYSNLCTSCFDNFFFNLKNNICIPIENSQQTRILNSKNEKNPIVLGENDFFYYDKQKTENCHFSCQICSSSEYDSCLVCNSNRIFTFSLSEQKNFCVCPPGTSDYGVYGCYNDYIMDQVKFTLITVSLLQIAFFLFSAIFEKGTFISLFTLIDYFQSISFLRFIDKMYQINLDDLFRALQFSNILNIQVLFEDNQSFKSLNVNSKFLLEKKTFQFFSDSMILVIIIAAVQLSYFIQKFLKYKYRYQKNVQDIAQKLIIFLNIFATQEIVLNIILNIQSSDAKSLQILQIVFALIFFILITIQTLYFIVKLAKENKYSVYLSKEKENIHLCSQNLSVSNQQKSPLESKKDSTKIVSNTIDYQSNDEFANSIQKQQNLQNQQNNQSNSQNFNKEKLKLLISYISFNLTKIIYPILLTLQSTSAEKVLILIGGAFTIKLFLVIIIFCFLKQNKTALSYTILKQIQFLAIVCLYITLIKQENQVTSIVFPSCIGLLIYIDSIIYVILKLLMMIAASIKYFIKNYKGMLEKK